MASVIPSAPLGTDAAAGSIGLGAASVSAPSGVAAERRFRFELAAHPGSPAQARRLTRARLTGWSVCEDTCDTAALVVSELVTNAIVHTASSHIVCELHDGGELVRIAVRDEGCAPGQPRANTRQQPEDEHGRGLLLIDALCHSWGAHENGPGLLVWADLPRTADAGGTGHGPVEPTDDLGWGARPKPGPPGTPDDDSADEPDRPHAPAAGNHGPAAETPGPTAGDQTPTPPAPPLPPHQRTPRPWSRA
ncbi:ATP-binding protein [Streptomyces sp. NRRL S-37]|uniref:ATP-binding protein n=1 Tax=Streptomyces sp. NRRL S-37 TaxID=1463903 RepID=UPI00099C5A05